MKNKYQVMPDLSFDDYAELKSDVALRGVQVAVEYDEEGNILDGHHRVRVCQELGITEWTKVVRVAIHATPAQQTEAVKRVENGEAPYLMEGYNQQKMEDYLSLPKEQRQAAEKNASEEDREETIRRNTDRAFSTIYDRVLFLRSDY